jgi:hypothetical protein
MRNNNLPLVTRTLSHATRFRRAVSEFRNNRYVSIPKAFGGMFSPAGDWEILPREKLKNSKTSDTIFILGSGPSLGWLNEAQIREINQNDSFGISLSFLFDQIIPNYHLLSLERESVENRGRTRMLDLFQDYRLSYKETVMLLPQKILFRLGHPRWLPQAFPVNPRIHYWHSQEKAPFSASAGFNAEYFEKSLIYRGTLTVALDIVVSLGYQTIVLIGVDPRRWRYFFQDDPRLQAYLDEGYRFSYGVPTGSGPDSPYVSMQPREGAEGTLIEYLTGLRSYLKKKRNVCLMTAFRSSDLGGILPEFFQE